MNLAWIAAVLAPGDVASRPNDVVDAPEQARLADLVLGRLDPNRPSSPLLDAARRALYNDTIRGAVPQLAALVRESASAEPARSAAYGLLLCSAAAELDEYTTCFDTLDLLLQAVAGDTADEALVRAVLLQQKALRNRDAGRPHLPCSRAAASALERVRPDDCTPFRTGFDERHHEDVLKTIIGNLRAAIGSLVTYREGEEEGLHYLLEWRREGQRCGSELTQRAALERGNRYADYVKTAFKEEFDRRKRIFQAGGYSDLFVSTLFLELAGHGNVYAARRELAVLRLMQLNQNAIDAADALRLLRHATAKDELAFVLRTFVDAGPLPALAADARQILGTRVDPERLRIVELQVLQSAADLLTPADARHGLDAVRAVLDAGGPPDLPGKWQMEVLRRSAAWSAASALSNVCGATSEVSELLLAEAQQAPATEDEILDGELRRAVGLLDWDEIGADQRDLWLAERTHLAGRLPRTMTLVSERAGLPVDPVRSTWWLERLAIDLNNAMNKLQPPPTVEEREVASLREEMSKIRANAEAGRYEMGGLCVADIATAAAITCGVIDLWPDLVDFLLDVTVSREDRGPAFDRLARADITLPDQIARSFGERINRALVEASVIDFPAVTTDIHAAALRFAGAHDLLSEAEVHNYTARLLGSPDAQSRLDGVRTIALLARKGLFDGLLPMVLPFADDENVEVRAMAAVALVQFAGHNGPMRSLAVDRILVLLGADGTLLPMATLNAIADVPALLDLEDYGLLFQTRLAELRNHPARSIRLRAADVRRRVDRR